MHRLDISLYSAMQTIMLRLAINNAHKQFRHANEFSAWAVAEMKRLKKLQSVDKELFKFFRRVLLPNENGFQQRWEQRLERYYQIQQTLIECAAMAQEERLKKVFGELGEEGVLQQFPYEPPLSFSDNESEQLLQFGFIGVERNELKKFEGSEDNPVYITVFIPKQQPQIEVTLVRSLQKYGFNLVIAEGQKTGQLPRETFCHVELVDFKEEVSG